MDRFVYGTAIVVAAFAMRGFAETYFWAGSSGDILLKAANWRLADGSVPSSYPRDGADAVFTNATAITVNKQGKTTWRNYCFRGADVDFSPNSDRFGLRGGGGIYVTGPGRCTFRHALECNNTNGAGFTGEDSTFTIDVCGGSEVWHATTGALKIEAGVEVRKKGAGLFRVENIFDANNSSAAPGDIVLEAGTILLARSTTRNNYVDELHISGSSAKSIQMDATALTVGRYVEDPDAAETLTFDLTAGTGYAVKFGGAFDARFSAALVNSGSSSATIVLNWDPGAENTLTIVKRVYNSPTAIFAVNSGTLRFAEGAGAVSANAITVAAGASLAIAADASSDFRGVPLELASGAKLLLERGTWDFRSVRFGSGKVSYAGTTIPDGMYTSADYPDWLEGDATMIVGTVADSTATWTGNGSSTSVRDPGNWGGTTPNLSNGTLVATFPANATVNVDSTCRFRGIVIEEGSNEDILGFTGTGHVWIGENGLSMTGSGRLSFSCKLYLEVTQTWTVSDNQITFTADSEIVSAGAVWSVDSSYDCKGSTGDRFAINCTNLRLGAADLKVGGVVVTADNALGSEGNCVRISGACRPRYMLKASASLLSGDLVLHSVPGGNNSMRTFCVQGNPTTFSGRVTVEHANEDYWVCENGARALFQGGLRSLIGVNKAAMSLPRLDGYDVTVTNIPAEISKLNLSCSGRYVYWTSSNTVKRGIFIGHRGALLETYRSDAFTRGTSAAVVSGVGFSDMGTWNLHGTSQSIQILTGTSGRITSDTPATLTIHADTVYVSDHSTHTETDPWYQAEAVTQETDRVCFEGAVSLVKEGALPHYCGGISTSTGTVAVTEGSLVFPNGAAWPAATGLTVSGTGCVTIEAANVFGRDIPITVDGSATARLSIPSGVTVRCGSLTVNGVTTGHAPAGLVSGGGVLQVGPTGLSIIFR